MKSENEELIKEILSKKGLSDDCFDPLDAYFQLMENNLETLKRLAKSQNDKLKNKLDLTIHEYLLPINNYEIDALKSKIKEMKLDKAHKIKNIVWQKFPNVIIDDRLIDKFVKSQETFDAKEILFFIIENYGINEEIISLTNIQNCVRKSIPWRDKPLDYVSTIKDIVPLGKNGVKFETFDQTDVISISKFAQIVIGKDSPSEVEGWKNPVAGGVYHGDFCIKNMHFYNNGMVTILFHDEAHVQKFSEAIFTKPDELMNQLFKR